MIEDFIINLIKDFYIETSQVPTISVFANKYNLHSSSIIRQFGSWNSLLNKAGLKPNKATKRTDEQLLLWIKSHPNAKYSDIPSGIRSSLEDRFGSLTNARNKAGLSITDWRTLTKKKNKYNTNGGRPIEYNKDYIIDGLRKLAISLGRPPRMKDINKNVCGFPISAILSRFGTFNNALQIAQLPPVYSYHEFNKLENELEKLLVNIKIAINDIPTFYDVEMNGYKPKFIYKDRWEDVILTRNDIYSSISSLLKYKTQCENLIVYYLVDDSLYENENIKMICVMDFIKKLNNKILVDKINELRLKYDEINRKYIGQPILEIK